MMLVPSILKSLPSSAKSHRSFARQPLITLSLSVAALMPMAEIAQAQLAINCTQDLRFDTFAACGGGGTLKVTAKSGMVSDSGCVIPLGSAKRAVCAVHNFATSGSLQIKVSAQTMQLGGANNMTIKQFNIGTAAGGPTKTYASISLTATPLTFGVGASALVSGNQTIGNYSGQVVMTVIFTP